MDARPTAGTNALLLVAIGFLAIIASHIAAAPIFGVVGYIAFLFAAATAVGHAIRLISEGFNSTPAEKRPADRYPDVPAAP